MTADQAEAALGRALTALGESPVDVALERSRDRANSDWASPVALRAAQVAGGQADVLAERLAARLRRDSALGHAAATGHGFVEFAFADRSPEAIARHVVASGSAYGIRAVVINSHDWPGGRAVQYAASRAASVLRNAAEMDLTTLPPPDTGAWLTDPSESALADLLAEFPAVAPHGLSRHLELVADSFLEAQAVAPALPRGDDSVTGLHSARLLLVTATRQVLANGLRLLGLRAPERM